MIGRVLDERIRARIGTVLGRRYRLERVIGAGGMGAVYAAAGEGGEPVAVKVLHADERMSGDLRARFLREGWVANRVGHEGVVRVIDGGTEEDGTAYIVMELLEGESLAAYWQRQNKQLPVGQVVAIARRLLD